MSRHVVFGTGQIGRLVATRLVSLGADVTAVNRTGRGAVNGARVVAGDATDPVFAAGVCAGADAVYFCLNAPHYDNWAREFPPMQRGVLTAAEAAGARLVVPRRGPRHPRCCHPRAEPVVSRMSERELR